MPGKLLKLDVERESEKRESAEAEKLRRGRVDPEGLSLRGELGTSDSLQLVCTGQGNAWKSQWRDCSGWDLSLISSLDPASLFSVVGGPFIYCPAYACYRRSASLDFNMAMRARKKIHAPRRVSLSSFDLGYALICGSGCTGQRSSMTASRK